MADGITDNKNLSALDVIGQEKARRIAAYLVRERYAAAHDDKWDSYENYTEALSIIYNALYPFTEFD